MTHPPLTRDLHRRKGPPPVRFLGDLSLARPRVHEGCGPARRGFAMLVARALEGPVFWIHPGWLPERLNPEGMLRFIAPGRVTFLTLRRPEDLLWTMEESLRAGLVPLTVIDLPNPPGLTPMRRLQLAAETGAAEGKLPPLGLVLTPGDGGAQGAESRWHMRGAHDAGQTGWRLSRRRARGEPPAAWRIEAKAGSLSLRPEEAELA
ncbi:MAG: hypothetical protein HUJ27_11045 [Rhodobacteraceae bacterium]|nr:hypothetical protein [Paracoccaceae bacterium]